MSALATGGKSKMGWGGGGLGQPWQRCDTLQIFAVHSLFNHKTNGANDSLLLLNASCHCFSSSPFTSHDLADLLCTLMLMCTDTKQLCTKKGCAVMMSQNGTGPLFLWHPVDKEIRLLSREPQRKTHIFSCRRRFSERGYLSSHSPLVPSSI